MYIFYLQHSQVRPDTLQMLNSYMWLLATTLDYEAKDNENTVKVFKETGTFIPEKLQSRSNTSKAQVCGREGGRKKERKERKGGVYYELPLIDLF